MEGIVGGQAWAQVAVEETGYTRPGELGLVMGSAASEPRSGNDRQDGPSGGAGQ